MGCRSKTCSCALGPSETLDIAGSGTGDDPWSIELRQALNGRFIYAFDTEAERDATLLDPQVGDYADIASADGHTMLTRYNGSAWKMVSPAPMERMPVFIPAGPTDYSAHSVWGNWILGNTIDVPSWCNLVEMDVRVVRIQPLISTVTASLRARLGAAGPVGTEIEWPTFYDVNENNSYAWKTFITPTAFGAQQVIIQASRNGGGTGSIRVDVNSRLYCTARYHRL